MNQRIIKILTKFILLNSFLFSFESLHAQGNRVSGPEYRFTVRNDSIAYDQVINGYNDYCYIDQGYSFRGKILGEVDGYYHILLPTNGRIPGCGLGEIFVYSGYIVYQQINGGTTSPGTNGRTNPTNPSPNSGGCSNGAVAYASEVRSSSGACALVSTIAWAEGTNSRYDYIFNYKTFVIGYDHPRVVNCAGQYCSSAAGRYQILEKTWDTVIQPSNRFPDFSEESQDRAAIFLITKRRVSEGQIFSRMDYTSLQQVMNKISYEWASLPPGRYGQSKKSMNSIWDTYSRFSN